MTRRPIRPAELAEPDRPIRPRCDPRRAAHRGDPAGKLRDDAVSSDPPDPRASVLGEPERTVRARRDRIEIAFRRDALRVVLETVPSALMRPIRLWPLSINHIAPSDPAAIPVGSLPAVNPAEYSMMTPVVEMLPTLLPSASVNHRLP